MFIVPHPNIAFFDNFLAECESAHLRYSRITVLDVNADLLKPSSLQTKILSVMKHNLLTFFMLQLEFLRTVLLRLMC